MVGNQRRGLINRLIKLIKSRPAGIAGIDEKIKSASRRMAVTGRTGIADFPSILVYSNTCAAFMAPAQALRTAGTLGANLLTRHQAKT